jgi:hypothetical protein
MNFEQRLRRAIERGEQSRDAARQADRQRELSAEELRNRYSHARIELTEHIELCLRRLADHFPGFALASIVEEDWGARITRDDLRLRAGRPHAAEYSRLEVTVSPRGAADILEVVAKGTIRNKEVFNRRFYQPLRELDLDTIRDQIDLWVLEYAEQFAAQN